MRLQLQQLLRLALFLLATASTSTSFSMHGIKGDLLALRADRKQPSSHQLFSTNSPLSKDNAALLSERGRAAVQALIDHDKSNSDMAQNHVYGDWPPAGTNDAEKQQLAEQLADLSASYPGGLPLYLTKARKLLKEASEGTNPFSEYNASIPDGERLEYDSPEYRQFEERGLAAADGAVFCLVAGGLGERLGYSGIKVSLPTNLVEGSCFLQLYADYIVALQARVRKAKRDNSIVLPLVIMTSGDTDEATHKLLDQNNNFGLAQVTIVKQEKVAALRDRTAGLALKDDNRWKVQTKPHGHGDVHTLLRPMVEGWRQEGKSHVIFLQDTNALVVNSILPTLGVSLDYQFCMNSICIPRLAGESAGAITKLE